MSEFEFNLMCGKLCTAIFMIIASYFGTIRFHETRFGFRKPFNDFVPLGFIEESPSVINTEAVVNIKPTTKRKPVKTQQTKTQPSKPQQPRNKFGFTKLQQDCYDALKGLKVTSKEAKYLIHSVFNQHNPKNIQDFLQLAFMRGR